MAIGIPPFLRLFSRQLHQRRSRPKDVGNPGIRATFAAFRITAVETAYPFGRPSRDKVGEVLISNVPLKTL